MRISADCRPQCFANEAKSMRAFLETTHAITFTDEDMKAPYPDHRKALYLEAQINEVYIRRALVDTGSYVNIILLDMLDAAKITRDKIVNHWLYNETLYPPWLRRPLIKHKKFTFIIAGIINLLVICQYQVW